MKLFISYRRDDLELVVPLQALLLHWFHEDDVFFDQDSIGPGRSFKPEIARAIDASCAFLAVIGPRWCEDRNLQRLKEDGDLVRKEIHTALTKSHANGGKPPFVIPVLVGSCPMPREEHLPEDIRPVCESNAVAVGGRYYRLEFQKLLDALQEECGHASPLNYRKGEGQPFHASDMRLSRYFSDPAGELGKLYEALQREGGAAVTAAATVQGMGGVGKTQLALKYSHAFRDEYAGIWWFRAQDTTLLEQDCLAFRDSQGLPAIEGEPPHRAVARFLAGTRNRWLLVYDNAEDPRELAPYLPASGHHIVVTSRTPNWDQAIVELGTWSEDEAQDFLRKRLPAAADQDRRSLATALGGLPLALEQAAAYILKTGVEIADYLAALHDWEESTRLLDLAETPSYPRSVLATLSLAFGRLSPPARQLLSLSGWLAADPIPERLFTDHRDLLPPALAERAVSRLSWRETVAELTGYALCRPLDIPALSTPSGQTEKGKERALQLHRLTQEAVRAKLSEEGAGLAAALALLRAVFPEDAKNPHNWPTHAALLPHVRGLERFAEMEGFDPHRHLWLLDRAASYLRFGPALYGEARRVFERALRDARRILGDEDGGTLTVASDLAETLWAQGDLAGARALEEKTLDIRRRVLGEKHPDTLTSMNNLAGTLWSQGDLAGARALHEKELGICRRVLGEEHPNTLISMNNLAETLWAQGDLAGARALQEKVLDIRRRVLGEEHPSTLTSMNNLANTLWAQGDLTGARALEEKTLDIRRRVLGEEHPDTLTSMGNLAHTLWAQGDLAGARALEEKALEIRRRVLGEKHPDTLTSMANLAETLKSQGHLAEARALEQQAQDIRRRVLGNRHPDTSISAFNLFVSLLKAGEDARSAEVFHHDLAWLLDQNPATLGADQRTIREHLSTMLESGASAQP